MSDTADFIAPKERQEASGSHMSPSPPPYSFEGQQPPPYSAAPETYSETTCTYQPVTGYESFQDIGLNVPTDTTPLLASSSFEDKTVRRGFVRKVFGILTVQLLFTFSVVCVFTFSSAVKEAVQTNLWAYITSFIIFAVVAVTLSYCESFNRRHPWNIVGLVVVTLSFSYMAGTIASFHDTSAVVITMAVTMVISLAIIIFSAQTRYDFTMFYGVLLILAVDLMMFGFFCTFYSSYITDIAYGCFGALLYSLFLMVDCQLMMGMMSFRLDPEEYINAALFIYLDIVLIFLYLLGRR
ncbi:protein lifeguard 1 [Echeneis naucrates]|uniref:Protein lifeguard 1-like n=1 Tax=Echeneis naucrates TaxID=173247 RepID=A0A665U638_ECHNA|nr:protein lifeguard 1-like [Echeneis naucrates]XP_029379865.1 protein lifeguard 1-like [Echeneis naucrates]XP_029379866.1 protein lifeguard 1-like [Echeneis naucrates]XP_029379867.1 protein lifeguard 1-like [Echeneis naucrates]XP_029379868.1 protein lifeguard 1-like [Echeneis naucrates]